MPNPLVINSETFQVTYQTTSETLEISHKTSGGIYEIPLDMTELVRLQQSLQAIITNLEQERSDSNE